MTDRQTDWLSDFSGWSKEMQSAQKQVITADVMHLFVNSEQGANNVSPLSPVNTMQCSGLASEQGITVSHAHTELTGQWRTCYWNLPHRKAICWIRLEISYNKLELFSDPWVSCSPLPLDPKPLQCTHSRDILLMLGMDCSSIATWLSADLKQEKTWHKNSDSVVYETWKFLTGVISLAKLSDVPLHIEQELWLHLPWDKQETIFLSKHLQNHWAVQAGTSSLAARVTWPTPLDHCL